MPLLQGILRTIGLRGVPDGGFDACELLRLALEAAATGSGAPDDPLAASCADLVIEASCHVHICRKLAQFVDKTATAPDDPLAVSCAKFVIEVSCSWSSKHTSLFVPSCILGLKRPDVQFRLTGICQP